jgi:transposase
LSIYFGAKKVKGKKGIIAKAIMSTAGKTPVFRLLKRDGNVYVEIVKNCSKEQLIPIIQGKILK